VAPEDRDVAFVEEWRDTVLTHAEARARLARIAALGLTDLVRRHHPEGPGPFTWWDYRQLGFPRGNGLRIDHCLATAALAARCTGAWVDRDERKGKLPSDHAPVVIEVTGDG
jgi:exodeoxyribonuclease-3